MDDDVAPLPSTVASTSQVDTPRPSPSVENNPSLKGPKAFGKNGCAKMKTKSTLLKNPPTSASPADPAPPVVVNANGKQSAKRTANVPVPANAVAGAKKRRPTVKPKLPKPICPMDTIISEMDNLEKEKRQAKKKESDDEENPPNNHSATPVPGAYRAPTFVELLRIESDNTMVFDWLKRRTPSVCEMVLAYKMLRGRVDSYSGVYHERTRIKELTFHIPPDEELLAELQGPSLENGEEEKETVVETMEMPDGFVADPDQSSAARNARIADLKKHLAGRLHKTVADVEAMMPGDYWDVMAGIKKEMMFDVIDQMVSNGLKTEGVKEDEFGGNSGRNSVAMDISSVDDDSVDEPSIKPPVVGREPDNSVPTAPPALNCPISRYESPLTPSTSTKPIYRPSLPPQPPPMYNSPVGPHASIAPYCDSSSFLPPTHIGQPNISSFPRAPPPPQPLLACSQPVAPPDLGPPCLPPSNSSDMFAPSYNSYREPSPYIPPPARTNSATPSFVRPPPPPPPACDPSSAGIYSSTPVSQQAYPKGVVSNRKFNRKDKWKGKGNDKQRRRFQNAPELSPANTTPLGAVAGPSIEPLNSMRRRNQPNFMMRSPSAGQFSSFPSYQPPPSLLRSGDAGFSPPAPPPARPDSSSVMRTLFSALQPGSSAPSPPVNRPQQHHQHPPPFQSPVNGFSFRGPRYPNHLGPRR